MEANTSLQILVVILAGTLAVFLVLGIFTLIKIMQVLEQLKQITAKAEKVVDKAGAVGEFFQRATGPFSMVKVVGNIIEYYKEGRKRGDKDGKED